MLIARWAEFAGQFAACSDWVGMPAPARPCLEFVSQVVDLVRPARADKPAQSAQAEGREKPIMLEEFNAMFGTELVEKTQPIDPEKLAAELAELEEETSQAREPKPLPALVWKAPVIVEVPLPLIDGDPEMARKYAQHSAKMDDLSRFLPVGAA
jgi:hypothetical protein